MYCTPRYSTGTVCTCGCKINILNFTTINVCASSGKRFTGPGNEKQTPTHSFIVLLSADGEDNEIHSNTLNGIKGRHFRSGGHVKLFLCSKIAHDCSIHPRH